MRVLELEQRRGGGSCGNVSKLRSCRLPWEALGPSPPSPFFHTPSSPPVLPVPPPSLSHAPSPLPISPLSLPDPSPSLLPASSPLLPHLPRRPSLSPTPPPFLPSHLSPSPTAPPPPSPSFSLALPPLARWEGKLTRISSTNTTSSFSPMRTAADGGERAVLPNVQVCPLEGRARDQQGGGRSRFYLINTEATRVNDHICCTYGNYPVPL